MSLESFLNIWVSSDPLTKIVIIMFGVAAGIRFVLKIPAVKKWFQRKQPKLNNPHVKCPHYRDILAINEKVLREGNSTTRQVGRIEDKLTLKEQMKEAEAFLLDLEDLYKSTYLTAMKKFNGGKKSGLIDIKDVQHYYSILKEPLGASKELIRIWVGQNHFVDRTDAEFLEYIDIKFKALKSKNKGIFDEVYQTSVFEFISREDLYDLNKENVIPEAEKIFRVMFYRIRDIAKEKKKEIKKLYDDNKKVTGAIIGLSDEVLQ